MRNFFSRTLAGVTGLTLLLLTTPVYAYQGMWIDGSNLASEFGKSRSSGRGAPASTNLPPSISSIAAKWTDNDGNLWILGGLGTFNWEHPSGYFDTWNGHIIEIGDVALRQEFWKFDPSTGNWTDYTSPNIMPTFTSAGTATWVNPAGDLCIMDAQRIYRYNIPTDTWNHELTHSTVLRYGTLGIPDGTNSPGIRYDATTWVDNNNNVWLYGGRYIPDGSAEWEVGEYRDDVWMFNPTTWMWTWMSGSDVGREDLTPVYGTRGVFADANRPPQKYWEFWPVWVDSDNNLWTYQWEELWKYDTSRKQWAYISGDPDEAFEVPVYGTQNVPSAANHPGYRFEPAAWVGGDGNLWMFGGITYVTNNSGDGLVYPRCMGDVWYFDISAGAWVWAGGPQFIAPETTYVAPNVASTANQPAGRTGALAWKSTANRTYIFGGRSYEVHTTGNFETYRPYNDTWSYTRNNGEWTYLKGNAGVAAAPVINGPGQGDTVAGLRGSSTWTDSSGNLWMFGGTGWTFDYYVPTSFWSELINNAMWKFDMATLQWKYQGGFTGPGVYGQFGIEAPGNTPGARLNAASWPDPQGYLWLFGGEGYDVSNQYGYLNDLWRYNPATGLWAWFGGSQEINTIFTTQSPTGHQYPSSRAGAAVWHDGNGNVAMFGGHMQIYKNTDPATQDTYSIQRQTNDLWYFSCAAREWYQIQPDTSTLMYGDFVSYAHTYLGAFGNYGSLGVPSATTRPGAREEAMTWIGSDGHLYMYGGFGYASQDDEAAPPSQKWPRILADMWRLDISTMQWTWVSGFKNSNRFPDYASKNTFSPMNQPGSRHSAIAWSPGANRLAMMGGRSYGDIRNGIWTYNITTGTWSWSGIGNATDVFSNYGSRFSLSANNLPGQRVDSAFWQLPGGLVAIFGGEGYSSQGYGYMNDSWVIAP